MTPDQCKALLPILTAFAEGKAIQHRVTETSSIWQDGTNYCWCDNPALYRIKPEPRRVWLNAYGDRVVGSVAHGSEKLAKEASCSGVTGAVEFVEVVK